MKLLAVKKLAQIDSTFMSFVQIILDFLKTKNQQPAIKQISPYKIQIIPYTEMKEDTIIELTFHQVINKNQVSKSFDNVCVDLKKEVNYHVRFVSGNKFWFSQISEFLSENNEIKTFLEKEAC